VTDISLKFFQQFDRNIKIRTYKKGSKIYESLTYAIASCAERILLSLTDYTPDDFVLPLAMDGATGKPVGPWGGLQNLAAALSVYDAYNGLIPPSWAHLLLF